MDLFDSELRVIDAAKALAAKLGDDPNHTVAAAVMDTLGRIHTGVNVYHFTGGPCAELVAIGAAAAAHAGPLVTIAAAGCDDRGLLAPCGRCRQVILDLHPDALIALPDEQGRTTSAMAEAAGTAGAAGTVGAAGTASAAGTAGTASAAGTASGSTYDIAAITALLPRSYRHPDAEPTRLLRFSARYFDAITSAGKTLTVRWNESHTSGPALVYFENTDYGTAPVEITSVEDHRLSELTPQILQLSKSPTAEGYVANLREHYPAMPEDASVEVVTFRLSAPNI